jgi:hypothetical protein
MILKTILLSWGVTIQKCYVRGAEKVLDEFKKEPGLKVGQTTQDGKFSLSSLYDAWEHADRHQW